MTGNCQEWEGERFPSGYGYVSSAERREYGTPLAHRVAWIKANGPIPDGMKILHSCDNPPCVNLAHLSVGTQSKNIADAVARGRITHLGKAQRSRTHCARRHAFTPENTRVNTDGSRSCRTCRREDQANYTARKAQNVHV